MKKKNLSLFLSAASLAACILAGTSMDAQAAENVTINADNFPDKYFRSFVRQYDQSGNRILEASELAAVETIDVRGNYFEDLTGIEHFVNLKELNCYGNGLSSLDVSGLHNLTWLNCGDNNLSNLDISGLNNLIGLSCDCNNLSSLDVSNLNNLTYLDCSYNKLNCLDISNLNNITWLNCNANNLSSLNVSNLNPLDFHCDGNERTVLVSSKNQFDLSTLKDFDITKCSNWRGGTVSGNILTFQSDTVTYTYDTGATNVVPSPLADFTLKKTYMDAQAVKNVTINAENFPDKNFRAFIHKYDQNYNGILEATELAVVESMNVDENGVENLTGIEHFANLKKLNCYGNYMTNLDVSSLNNLTYLDCSSNNLIRLDVSGLNNLTYLNCSSNNLTSLDVSGLNSLTVLNCCLNKLTSLKPGKNLTTIDCDINSLTTLDISSLNKLTKLSCGHNELTSLDVSSLKSLAEFNCSSNVRNVSVSSKNQFNLSTLKGFDVKKCSNWNGGTVSGTILTFQSNTVTYTYNTGFTGDASSPLVKFTLKKSSQLATPAAAKLSNTASGIKIIWSTVSGAEKYRVYRKTASTGWSKIADTTSASYVDTTAKSGTAYTYTIRCINAAGTAFTSDYNKTGSTLVRLAQPTIKAANTSTGVKLSWSAVSGADSYILYYKTTGSWTRVAADPVKGTSYTWKGAKSGTSYKFTMKAVKGSTQSSYNTTGTSLTYVAQPTVKAANASTGVKLSWSAISGADSYILYYKTTGSWTRVVADPVTGTSYTWKGAKSGTSYKFTMKAVKGSTQSSYNTTGTSLVRLTQPTLGTLSRSGKNLTLTWSKVTGASAYRVYRKTGTGSWVRIATVTGTSYTDVYNDTSALSKGTTYTYTVRAEKGSSLSSYNATGKKITY